MLLVFNRGGPGSYRSHCRERRGVIPQKETRFYSYIKAQQIPGASVSIFRTTEFARKPHTGQDEPYSLAAAAKYGEYQAQYPHEFHLRVR